MHQISNIFEILSKIIPPSFEETQFKLCFSVVFFFRWIIILVEYVVFFTVLKGRADFIGLFCPICPSNLFCPSISSIYYGRLAHANGSTIQQFRRWSLGAPRNSYPYIKISGCSIISVTLVIPGKTEKMIIPMIQTLVPKPKYVLPLVTI